MVFMFSFSTAQPNKHVGLFFVRRKGDTQRMIKDARAVNERFRTPQAMLMTSPEGLSRLEARNIVNRHTSHTAHFNMYRCAQSVRTSHMMLHAHAWLKFKLCLPQDSHCISCAMSHAMHGTRSTSSSSFSSVPGLQMLLTSRNPCADPREHGSDG